MPDDPVGLGLVLVPQLVPRLPVDLPDALELVAGARLPELALDRGRVVVGRQLLRQFALVLGVPVGVLVVCEDPVYPVPAQKSESRSREAVVSSRPHTRFLLTTVRELRQ